MHNDRVIRRPAACAALLAVAALALAGCGGGSSSTPAPARPARRHAAARRRRPARRLDARRPRGHGAGRDAHRPGHRSSKLGQAAKVSWQPNQKQVGVMKVSVTKLQKVPISAFSDWRLDAATQRSTPYFVHATVHNLGDDARCPASRCRSTCSTGATPSCRRRPSGPQFPAVPEHAAAGEVHARQEGLGLPGLLRARPRHARPRSASARPRTSTPSPGPARSRRRSRRRRPRRPSSARVWPAARPGAADNRRMSPLTLGSLTVPTPVVLAPMAGITNAAYRRLCAEQGAGPLRLRDDHLPRAGRARLARP